MSARLKRAIRRYLPLVLLLAAVGGISAYVAARERITYQAQASFRLIPGDPTANLTNPQTGTAAQPTGEGYATTEAAVIQSQPVIELIAAGAEVEPDQVRAALTITPDTTALVIRAVAKTTEKQRSIDIANGVLPAYSKYRAKQRRNQLRRSAQTLAKQEKRLLETAITLRKRLGDTDSETRRNQLNIRLQSALDRYDLVAARRQDLSARGQTSIESAQLVRAATGATPSGTRTFALAGVLLGGILGLVLALVFEQLRPVLRDDDDLERLSGAKTLARLSSAGLFSGQLPAIKRPAGPLTDGLRTLRVGLARNSAGVVLVTSAARRDGKTFVASNLAVVAAQGGQKTALISGDLRNQTVDKTFRVADSTTSLASLLALDPDAAANAVPEAMRAVGPVPGLDILAGGESSGNPADLLARPSLPAILTALDAAYDLVIVDAPPILPVPDSLIYADFVDTILLVVAVEQTTSSDLPAAAQMLRHEQTRANIFVVANHASGTAARPYSRS